MSIRALNDLMTLYCDAAGDGTGGGAAAASGTSDAGAATSTATAAAGAPAGAGAQGDGTQGAGGNTRTGAATSGQFVYTEDRSQWVPPHRFKEVSERAKSVSQLQADLADRDRKIAALAGVQSADPNAQKSEQVRAAFFEMFPQFKHLANLSEDQMQQIIAAPAQASRATELEQREWRRHGAAQMATVYTNVAEALGTDSLTDTQKEDLSEGFARWFKAKCKAELDASGGEASATYTRYENGDPKLLDEFTKRYLADWVEPARRRATTQQLNRTRPVPNSQGRVAVTSVTRPQEFKTLDERLEYGVALAKERGAQFGSQG